MKKFWKKTEKTDDYKINGKFVSVEKLNFSELIDLTFLILPYLKLIKRIRTEYSSASQAEVFRFTIQTLLEAIGKDDIYKIFSLVLHLPEEEIKQASVEELTYIVPQLIRKNNLLDLYLLMKRLGATDGG